MALRNKVAIITGASSGIGAAIAQCFSKEGVSACITGRRKEQLDSVAKKCQELSGAESDTILTVLGDITHKSTREILVQKTLEKFKKIDILVNNAGIGFFPPFADLTEEDYDTLMNTNVKASVFLAQTAMPHLIQAKGTLINVSSIAAARVADGGAYSMTKSSMDILTKILARDYGPMGVRVNSINPGFILDTDIFRTMEEEQTKEVLGVIASKVPLQRNGSPEEVAKTALFLVSDAASFITGESLFVDGGIFTNHGFF